LERIKRRLTIFPTVTDEVYNGGREQRASRNFTSVLIGNYVRAIRLSETLGGPTVVIEPDAADEVLVLKFSRAIT
jgi:dGTPase